MSKWLNDQNTLSKSKTLQILQVVAFHFRNTGHYFGAKTKYWSAFSATYHMKREPYSSSWCFQSSTRDWTIGWTGKILWDSQRNTFERDGCSQLLIDNSANKGAYQNSEWCLKSSVYSSVTVDRQWQWRLKSDARSWPMPDSYPERIA